MNAASGPMLKLLACPRGHYWEAAEGVADALACPTCGDAPETLPLLDLVAVAVPQAPPPPPLPLPLRDATGRPIVAGYDIQEDLGRGPAGINRYRARQLVVQRTVLLEVVFAREDSGQLAWGALRSCAAALAKLDHPNILQIYEIGERDRQLFYNAVEAVEGPTLAAALQGKPLPVREALGLLEVLARALHCAHDKGLVHRSLQPASIRLQPVDEGGKGKTPPAPAAPPVCRIHGTLYLPKIADWGLARRPVEGEVNDVDLQGEHPSYLSPEQAWGRSRDIGPATDIYALGAIFYECLTARPPFRGPTPAETLDKVYTGEPTPLTRFRRLPADVNALARRCLAKQPQRRYNAALQLAADVRRCLDGRPILGRRTSAAEQVGRWVRRGWAAVLFLLLGAVAGGLLAWWGLSGSPRLSSAPVQDVLNKAAAAQSAAQQRTQEIDYFRRILLAERALAANEILLPGVLTDCAREHRRWEWNYLYRRQQGNVDTVITSVGPWNCLSISHDGNEVAACNTEPGNAAAAGAEVASWRTSLGGRIARFNEGEESQVRAVAYSPVSERLALLRDKGNDRFQIEFFHPSTGINALNVAAPAPEIASMTYAPDGSRLVLLDRRGRVYLIDSGTGRLVTTRSVGDVRWTQPWPGQPSVARAVALSKNGDRVAAVSPDGRMVVTQVAAPASTAQPGLRHCPQEVVVLALATHCDTGRVAIGLKDHTIRLFPEAGQPMILVGHRDEVTGLAFSADGRRLVSCSKDGTVKVWDPSSGLAVLTVPISDGAPSAVAFGANDTILAVAHGSKITIFGRP